MKTAAPDIITALRAQIVLSKARRDGRDEIEALYRAGLLVTPSGTKAFKLDALTALEESLESWHPREYLRKVRRAGSYSPDDMYRAMMMYVNEYIAAYREEL